MVDHSILLRELACFDIVKKSLLTSQKANQARTLFFVSFYSIIYAVCVLLLDDFNIVSQNAPLLFLLNFNFCLCLRIQTNCLSHNVFPKCCSSFTLS